MNKVNNRYTDQELIELLHIWCSDFSKKPTQRDLLADNRMPTHHTYINRFGSLKNAMEVAGILNVQNTSTLHGIIASLLSEKNVKYSEYIKVANITVDFVIEGLHGQTIVVDIVNVDSYNVDDFSKNRIKEYRKLCIDSLNYETNLNIVHVDISNLFDINKIEKHI